jgi:hypothetical protein|tara:strand:+ start:67 stop:291 length:225 start_codon:yes stop_codon:yes gene_type:complete
MTRAEAVTQRTKLITAINAYYDDVTEETTTSGGPGGLLTRRRRVDITKLEERLEHLDGIIADADGTNVRAGASL